MARLKQLIMSIAATSLLALSAMAVAENAAEPAAAAQPTGTGTLGLLVRGASSGINTDYFEQTAAEALAASGLFSAVDTSRADAEIIMPMLTAKGVFPSSELSNNTPYVLEIRVIEVTAPAFSFSMTVDMRVVWTLYRTSDKSTLMREIITSTYTGGMFEGGLIGANRVRAGTEGAARENVRMGLELLRALELDTEPESITAGQ